MPTAQDDYAAVQAADAKVTADEAAVASAQTALTAAQATLSADQASAAAADKQLAADLAKGPGFITNADGSITLLEASAADPKGYTTTVIQPLASLSSVVPAPAPAPAPAAS